MVTAVPPFGLRRTSTARFGTDDAVPAGAGGGPVWLATPLELERVNHLVHRYRATVRATLQPLVEAHYPELLSADDGEYQKMLELSTKMTVVGHAVTKIAGLDFDQRRQEMAALYGGCCFLADSFIDDFGEERTREYLDRIETLLTSGWFEITSTREQLFYVILARLFADRDVMDPDLRQAIMWLFMAQRTDVELRSESGERPVSGTRGRLRLLEECARNRSGHAIMVLTTFLVPRISLRLRHAIFSAGALIMHIDDHGDCHFDLHNGRRTYMNQVRNPERVLRRIFERSAARIVADLPAGDGRDVMRGFLYRYYVTRINKHRVARDRAAERWAVYE